MATNTAIAVARKARLESLKTATLDYVSKERLRLENEAKSLKAVLDGRTGGKGIQKDAQAAVSKIAGNDLFYYLSGQEP